MKNDFFLSNRKAIKIFLNVNLSFSLLIAMHSSSFGATFISTNVVTTTWSMATSWTGGGIGATPGDENVVIIATGTTITLDVTVGTISALTVDGTLEFQAGTKKLRTTWRKKTINA